MSEYRTEREIKAAVIDRLFKKGEVCSDAVVISEMVVDSWSRRADVVLANGKLSAFEVKSDFDTLSRLPGQLESYCAHFERVVVVITPRFVKKVEEIAPEGVGIWVMEADGSEGIREKRRARTVELTPDAAINLMTVTDLRRLLTANGVSGIACAARRDLEAMARDLTKKDLAVAARDSVKRRFRAHFKRFQSRRAQYGTRTALGALKRAQRTIRVTPESPVDMDAPRVEIARDNPMLIHSPVGPVLRRLRHSSSS